MNRFTRTALAGIIVGALAATLAPVLTAPADAVNRRCEDTRKGRVCANVHTPPTGSKSARESRKLKTPRYLPMDSRTTVKYLGYARRDLTNGRDI